MPVNSAFTRARDGSTELQCLGAAVCTTPAPHCVAAVLTDELRMKSRSCPMLVPMSFSASACTRQQAASAHASPKPVNVHV